MYVVYGVGFGGEVVECGCVGGECVFVELGGGVGVGSDLDVLVG